MMWRLALPLVRPALITVAIYDALNVWNGFLFPLILTQSPEKRVLPLALWTFQGEFTVNIPAVLAAVVLSTLPILALYILGPPPAGRRAHRRVRQVANPLHRHRACGRRPRSRTEAVRSTYR